MGDPQRNRDAYMQILRACFMEDDDFSTAREQLLTELREALQLDDEVHLECLTAIAGDQEVNIVRDSLKAAGFRGAGAAASRLAPAAPGPSSMAALGKPSRAPRPPKPRQPDPLPAPASYPSAAAWKDLPPPPPPRSKGKGARPAASAQRPPLPAEEPLWRQPSKRAHKAAGRDGVPYPDATFQARVAGATEAELHTMLGALTQREAEVMAQLSDLDVQEAELQRPPVATRPSLPPAGVRKPQQASVTVAVAASGNMEELQTMLHKLASREKQIYYEILDLGLPDDDEELEAETRLRLKWHRLDRREQEVQANLRRVEASLAAA